MDIYQATNPLLQQYRNINIQLIIMDYTFNTIDELSGIAESVSLSNDSTSDIRRTANISMTLDSGYTNTGILNDMYFSAGNGFWFDKYLQINIGVQNNTNNEEVTYYPQGIYLVNEPSVTFDATTNGLSFNAVDLMAKLTGMRSGNMQGITYQIPADSVITDVMKDILIQEGFYKYILNEPEERLVPYEIKIEVGGTIYQILSELRDINPNWEIFFDIDGTFVFQKIPSGRLETRPEYSPTIIADDTDWDNLLIGYDLSTSFEEVKNYIEVYGKTIEPTVEGVVDISYISSGTISVTANTTNITGEKVDFVLVVLGDTSLDKIELETPISTIIFTDSSTTRTITCTPNMWYNNMAYILRIGNNHCEYLGYQQPCAIAWEDNENSPFYVGKEFISSTYQLIDDNNNYLSTNNDFHIIGVTQTVNNKYGTPTDKIIDENLFKGMVRHVCSGDEYDNIYSNQLAIDRAVYELYQRCRLHDTITIQCVPIYYLDSNQIISITLPNENDISYWIIKSISTDFEVSGTQTITAMRYYAEYPSN